MIVHNPTNTAVRDFPIQDLESKETRLWSVLPGETLDLPDSVGEYLLQVYAFLQRVVTAEQLKSEERIKKDIAANKQFNPIKIVEPEQIKEIIDPRLDLGKVEDENNN